MKKYEHKQVTQKNTKKQTAPKKQQVVTKKKETTAKEMTKKQQVVTKKKETTAKEMTKKQQVVTKKKETNVKEMTKKMIEAILFNEVMDMIAIKEDIERISSPEYIASRIVEAVIDEAVNIGDLLVKKKKKKNAAIEKKKKYNLGLEYDMGKGKVGTARTVKQGCNPVTCKRKCKTKIHHDSREKLMKSFWKLGSAQLRWAYISKTVKSKPPIYQKPGAIKHKTNSKTYCFEIEDREFMVCKKFYLDTLDISQSLVDIALAKKDEVGCVGSSNRSANKKSKSQDADEIKKHIASFPAVESHYCRKRTTKKYLAPGLSLNEMYRLYCKMRTEENAEHISSKSTYKRVFFNNFNLGFYKPKKDAGANTHLRIYQTRRGQK